MWPCLRAGRCLASTVPCHNNARKQTSSQQKRSSGTVDCNNEQFQRMHQKLRFYSLSLHRSAMTMMDPNPRIMIVSSRNSYRSLADNDGDDQSSSVNVRTFVSSKPPSECQVVSESCEWCLVPTPWNGDDEEEAATAAADPYQVTGSPKLYLAPPPNKRKGLSFNHQPSMSATMISSGDSPQRNSAASP
jgi:hypothetical protein